MGKCIFTGKDTSTGLKFNNEVYYLSPEIKDMISNALSSKDYDLKKRCLLDLQSKANTYDQNSIDSINNLLTIIKTNMKKYETNDSVQQVNSNKQIDDGFTCQRYDRIAKAFKIFFLVIFILSVIACIVIGAIVIDGINDAIGLVIMFVGPIISGIGYVSSLLFLELCTNVAEQRKTLEHLLYILSKK